MLRGQWWYVIYCDYYFERFKLFKLYRKPQARVYCVNLYPHTKQQSSIKVKSWTGNHGEPDPVQVLPGSGNISFCTQLMEEARVAVEVLQFRGVLCE